MIRITIALLAAALAASPQAQSKKPQSVTLTGCIDQRGEKYVLTEDERLNKKAVLRGRAFTDENFARYVGHKVKVQGSSTMEGEDRVISVDRLDDIAETCAPR